MPLDTYWKAKEILREADYLAANSDERVAITDLHRKAFLLLSKYASFERDRNWLLKQSGVSITT